jgi:hypothetical protein
MTCDDGPDIQIPENPLVLHLLERGVGEARLLRGFVGPSRSEGSIAIYQRLNRLSDFVEIARSDILHFVPAPGSELGALLLWVKKDATLSIRRLEPRVIFEAGKPPVDGSQRFKELSNGRLRMRMRVRDDDTCASVCSCETCTCTCAAIYARQDETR